MNTATTEEYGLGTRTPEKKKIRPFQIRWREPLGNKDCPYAFRWTINLKWFAIRVHQWIKTEDSRNMHDHPWDFYTLVVKGGYTDISEWPTVAAQQAAGYPIKIVDVTEIRRDKLSFGSIRWRPAIHKHYVEVNPGGCWTVLLTGPVVRKWGYWVKGKLVRPLRYFGKFGHPPCED